MWIDNVSPMILMRIPHITFLVVRSCSGLLYSARSCSTLPIQQLSIFSDEDSSVSFLPQTQRSAQSAAFLPSRRPYKGNTHANEIDREQNTLPGSKRDAGESNYTYGRNRWKLSRGTIVIWLGTGRRSLTRTCELRPLREPPW